MTEHVRHWPLVAGSGRSGERKLLVSEIFGPTVQGEGLGLGLPAVFLRMAGCALSCSWCDTAYAWDWVRFDKGSSVRRMETRDVWGELQALTAGSQTRTLVITGGEPASQARGLMPVVRLATDAAWRVEVETSGAVDLADLAGAVDLVTVSPKLSSAGMAESVRIRRDVLESLSGRPNVVWKFVIDSQRDLDEADQLVESLNLSTSRVMVMAQATTPAAVLDRTRWLVPAAIKRGYRTTPRLHTLMWGSERGR